MTILVFGQSGQLARALATHPDVICVGRDKVDLTDPATCATAIRDTQPSAVINAAAYTAVDKAEDEPDIAQAINGEAPGVMARTCAELDIPFVHVSTDYVFDGSGDAPRAPDAPVGPLGIYGRTKLAGEDAIRAAGGRYAILRTSWVFDGVGPNFVKTMERLGAERDALNVVDDQIGGPTPASALADACLAAASALLNNPDLAGTYHFAGAPDTSWAGFAKAIMETAGLDCTINPIPTSDYPTPATRPLNSRLDCGTTQRAFGVTRPDWRIALTRSVGTPQG